MTVRDEARALELAAIPGLAPAERRRGYRTLLLATDLTVVSEVAAERAMDLSAALSARLVVVNVINPNDRIVGTVLPTAMSARVDQLRADREGPVMAVVERARARGLDCRFLVWTGVPGPGIVAAAESEEADMVIVGTRALDSAGRFLLGSVSDYVVYHSACPVLVAR